MNHDKLLKALIQAKKYPLTERIAAKLHLTGVTCQDYHAGCLAITTQEPRYRRLDYPTVIDVYHKLRDIERGSLKITKSLQALADQIDL